MVLVTEFDMLETNCASPATSPGLRLIFIPLDFLKLFLHKGIVLTASSSTTSKVFSTQTEQSLSKICPLSSHPHKPLLLKPNTISKLKELFSVLILLLPAKINENTDHFLILKFLFFLPISTSDYLFSAAI